jgi:hypothetical protein
LRLRRIQSVDQNLTVRTFAIIVLGSAQWPVLRLHVARIWRTEEDSLLAVRLKD